MIKKSSAFSLILLLTSAAPELLSDFHAASASPWVAVASVPKGTNIRINGSSSLTAVNQALKQRFEKQFPEAQVSLESGGTAAGLQAVLEDRADLAAIGRPLTAQEKAKGLVAVPVGREKIAIVIGSNNRLTQGLDINQFAKIFRGEIKNWSQVGGSAGAIRLVDRPSTNDTRQSFRNYPAFQSGKFESGATAKKLSDESAQSVIQALGNNGISYLPLSQVRNQPGVKAVLMHGAAPTNARYPFSQPLLYVHKGTPNPVAAAFLSYATASAGQQAIRQTGAVALKSGEPAVSKKAASARAANNFSNNQVSQVPAIDDGGFGDLGLPSWLWWLFPLGSLGALFWMLGKGRDSQRPRSIQAYRDPNPDLLEESAPQVGADVGEAAWEQDDRTREADQSDWLFENPNLAPAANGTRAAEESVLADDRDLIESEDNPTQGTPSPDFSAPKNPGGAAAAAWSFLSEDRSDSPSAPSQVPTSASASGAAQGLVGQPEGEGASRLVLSPRSAQWVYASWDIPRSRKAEIQRQGDENLMLRLYDVTATELDAQLPERYEQFDCDDLALSCDIPIPAGDRTYVAEIGYLAADGQWLSLARSTPTWVAAHERMG